MDAVLFSERAVTRIGDVRLHAAVSETHSASASVTQHPVESGANIVDHVLREPDRLSIEGLITDSPLEGATGSPALDGYRALQDLMDRGEPIDVVTGLRVYRSMVLTSLNIPRSYDTGMALRFSAELTQVRVVQTQVEVPVDADVRDQLAPERESGRVAIESTSASNQQLVRDRLELP